MLEELKKRTEFRKELTDYVDILRSRSDPARLKEFSELRNIDMNEIEDTGIFYIEDMTKMMIPAYIDKLELFGVISPNNNKPIYHERWVIPIRDSDGLVQGLVGYSNKADERYVYATTQYYMRGDTLWGLERLNEAYDLGYAILTEGITDAIHVRSVGYRPVFATCGTRKSDINMFELNRCRFGIIRVHDRDAAGNKTKKHWITNRYCTLVTPIDYKDSDETLKQGQDNVEWFKEYMDACINWIKEKEHRGQKCETVTACMI